MILTLCGLAWTWYAIEESFSSITSQDTAKQQTITTHPTDDLSAVDMTSFFPEKEKVFDSKDSLNNIIESKISEIQKQREAEFLHGKFVELQKEIKKSVLAFIDDQIFSKEKQETLSDNQLHMYLKNISSAKDLPSLSSICEKIISYTDKLLNKKDVEVEWKILKTKNIKDPEFFVKIDEYKTTFKNFVTTIANVHFEPEVFKNVQPNPDVIKYSSTIESLKSSIAHQQDSLHAIQDSLVLLYKNLNDSTDKKIEVELELSSGKVNYAEYENNTIISDTNSLNQKHTMEQIENERKNYIVQLEWSILSINKDILAKEEYQIPSISKNIDNLYKEYWIALKSLIDAIRTQHTDIMTEKDKGISDQIWSFKVLITNIYSKMDSLKQQHQNILNAITTEKDKIHTSDSSSIESLLIKYQKEENLIAQTYAETNEELINKNITLWYMLLENYDIYLDMLTKCKNPLSGYFVDIEKEIASLEKEITDLQNKYDENQKEIKILSVSDNTNDVNTCQKLIKENQMCNAKIIETKKERDEKITTKNSIQAEINEIDNVAQYITNNKDLTRFGMKIYLAAKQIQSTQVQLKSAKDIKNHYELLLKEKNQTLIGVTQNLDAVNMDIKNMNTNLDTNNYAPLSRLMEQKDSLLLVSITLKSDITNISGKIDAKNREISKFEKEISNLTAFGTEELNKWKWLIYNRDQSFTWATNNSKYYKKELVRSPEVILDDVPTIVSTIENSK